MKTERVILSFIALLIGLGVAGGAFYLYQSTKAQPPVKKTVTVKNPSPTPNESGQILSIESPTDEEVVDQKTITIRGTTMADATVIITTETDEQVITPAKDGSFTTTQTIATGGNIIQITAIFADGTQKTVMRTVNFSSESF